MRISWSDEEDFSGQFGLWQANCERSLHGKKGQAVLRELEVALVAMPSKRLVADTMAAEGDVCAVGALLQARGTPMETLEQHGDYDDTADVAEAHGVPRLVAWKLVEMNDIQLKERSVYLEGPAQHPWQQFSSGGIGLRHIDLTPEERYEAMLAWVRSELKSGVAIQEVK